jgi:hypothetical protein
LKPGGARAGDGRPPKLGWHAVGFRLELETIHGIKQVAKWPKISQSELVNEILKKTFGIISPR